MPAPPPPSFLIFLLYGSLVVSAIVAALIPAPKESTALAWLLSLPPPCTDRAWQTAAEHLLYQQNLYQRWFTEASDRPADRYEPMVTASQLKRGSYLIGNPDDVLQQLRDYRRQVPFTHISIWMLLPGMRLAPALRSLELFCRKVMPALG